MTTNTPPDDGLLTADMIADRTYPHACYEVDVEWSMLEWHLARQAETSRDIDPDFQRGHVWNDAQRVAYVEHVLCGGETGKNLLVAHTGRLSHYKTRPDGTVYLPDYVLVDGKQRLDAVRRFMRDEFTVFAGVAGEADGYRWSPLGRWRTRRVGLAFKWRLVVCKNRNEILCLYVMFNAGGTAHSHEEIERVRAMMK